MSTAESPEVTDVFVVGAGPVGLVAGCELARRGVRVRVIDKLTQPTGRCGLVVGLECRDPTAAGSPVRILNQPSCLLVVAAAERVRTTTSRRVRGWDRGWVAPRVGVELVGGPAIPGSVVGRCRR